MSRPGIKCDQCGKIGELIVVGGRYGKPPEGWLFEQFVEHEYVESRYACSVACAEANAKADVIREAWHAAKRGAEIRLNAEIEESAARGMVERFGADWRAKAGIK